jgi:16S rRNA processing protein RimM
LRNLSAEEGEKRLVVGASVINFSSFFVWNFYCRHQLFIHQSIMTTRRIIRRVAASVCILVTVAAILLSKNYVGDHDSTLVVHAFDLKITSYRQKLSSRSRPRTRPYVFPLFASVDKDPKGQPQPQQRKKKKNKYAKFSKADKKTIDPYEELIQESKEKIKQLEMEQQKQAIPDIPMPKEFSQRLEFPNNKDIDPYDPTSFGYVEIGTILGPHGVHGWTKVQGCTDFPERLTTSGMLLHIKPFRKRAPRKIVLAGGKMTGPDSFIIQLQDSYDREAAQKLKGATLYYSTQQDKVATGEDGMLLSEMVGLEVFLIDEDDTHVGVVQGVVLAEEMCSIPGLGQDMLEIEVASSPERRDPFDRKPKELVLIPMVPEIVPKIDLTSKRIEIDPPAGLLDLTYIREEKVVIKGFLPPARD